ncbi:MAG: sulfite exporter TauE/SafE family protein [Bacilli bacterium]
MQEIITIIIGGILAGVVTGLVVASAAVVITPIFVTALGMDDYTAISIALATDVFASSISAFTYAKNKLIRVKSAIPMVIFASLGSVLGSYMASFVEGNTLSSISVIVTLVIGIRFLWTAEDAPKDVSSGSTSKNELIIKIILGFIIGCICGYIGAGGGMIILAILMIILKYDMKEAVGTSVFIMTFTALSGAISHFPHMDLIPIKAIMLSGIFSIVGAYFAAKFVAKASLPLSKKVAGVLLIIIYAITS